MDIISRVKVIIDELSHDKKDKICIFDKYMYIIITIAICSINL